jgi:hypothetical protein
MDRQPRRRVPPRQHVLACGRFAADAVLGAEQRQQARIGVGPERRERRHEIRGDPAGPRQQAQRRAA